ncbi:MAG: glycosyltransferase [Chloroflexi bacterium]|nr:glycosyltransferase [Chloroflexota bacterium]
MKISLIITVLNEARSLPTLLDSIAAQTRQPDEVVICDGGSIDGTLELLSAETRFPVRVIERPGSNISQGRNAAIEAATGEVIASTDAGVRLDPRWLEKLVEPLAPIPTCAPAHFSVPRSEKMGLGKEVVAGFFLPDVHTPFEIAMGATVLPQLKDIDPAKFLPSSRSVAFTKTAWQAVGGYPEWLDYCEDLIFDLALRDKVGAFAFAPEAIVYFRPRSSIKSFFKQYYLYARGDGKTNLWLKRHLIRYATYLIALPAITWLTAKIHPGFALLYAVGAAVYLKQPYQHLRAMKHPLDRSGQLKAIGWIPVIRVVGDIAKMVGYPVGMWWRRRRRIGGIGG